MPFRCSPHKGVLAKRHLGAVGAKVLFWLVPKAILVLMFSTKMANSRKNSGKIKKLYSEFGI